MLESVTEDIDKSPLGEAITYLRGTLFARQKVSKSFRFMKWKATKKSGTIGLPVIMNTRGVIGNPWKPVEEDTLISWQ